MYIFILTQYSLKYCSLRKTIKLHNKSRFQFVEYLLGVEMNWTWFIVEISNGVAPRTTPTVQPTICPRQLEIIASPHAQTAHTHFLSTFGRPT